MTSNPDATPDPDLAALREEIDELKKIPKEDLVSPALGAAPQDEVEPTPEPTDAPGSEDWTSAE